ncbi:phage antirepressor KilAC domain-containing protein [Mycobacterium botniense]|uniref:Antirepressor protein C-terminal domain-containing protein n=1 Tax=Mycobacterium botniense TaxID=84962 RepID=A0A7I9XRV1_9MYCO|nr:phage antirepressor KilAC domain-containing protein [Mycobacterium botniense]GFG72721.1 hypothetical protein MBOT_00860 [Mycobacterium botniense]
MTVDLTAASARADRDRLASRTDVLDKVGVLRTLPDDMHVTTDMVAAFYEVPAKTIQTVVLRNRDELDDDGLKVIGRAEFEETFNMKVTSSASSFTLYPRRAVLRIGMLLRGSEVARKVRDYLINTEQAARDVDPRHVAAMLTRADLARMVLEAEAEREAMAAALESAAPAIAYHERYVSNDDAALVRVWGAQFGLTQGQAFQTLLDHKLIYRVSIGRRWSKTHQRVVEEYEYRPYARYVDWFDLRPQHDAPRHHNGQVRQTLYERQEFALEIAERVGLGVSR